LIHLHIYLSFIIERIMEREADYKSKDSYEKVHFLLIRLRNIIATNQKTTITITKRRRNINNKGKTFTSIFCY